MAEAMTIGTVGRPKPRSGGNGHGGGYAVEYSLCRLTAETGTLEPITLLRNTFF